MKKSINNLDLLHTKKKKSIDIYPLILSTKNS